MAKKEVVVPKGEPAPAVSSRAALDPKDSTVFVTKRDYTDEHGNVTKAGGLVDLSHADPLRVQKMVEQRLLFSAQDWDASAKSTRAAQIRRDLDLQAHALGREISDRMREAKDRNERKHLRAMADEAEVIEAELLKERDHRLRLLRLNCEAATRELQASVRR